MKHRALFTTTAPIVLLSLIIGACKPATPTPVSGQSEHPAEPTAVTGTEPAEPPAEITYYFPSGALPDAATVEQALNAVLVPTINATIRIMATDWGAYDDKMNMMFTGKEECDIVFTAPWINNYYQAVHDESLLALDDLLPTETPALFASEKPQDWDAVRVNGKIYAVPTLTNRAKWWGFAARQDLAEKYGLDLDSIKGWEDLEPFMAEIVENEPGVIPWGDAPRFREEIYGWDPLDDSIGYDDVSIIG